MAVANFSGLYDVYNRFFFWTSGYTITGTAGKRVEQKAVPVPDPDIREYSDRVIQGTVYPAADGGRPGTEGPVICPA
jgi:hypothetical protein